MISCLIARLVYQLDIKLQQKNSKPNRDQIQQIAKTARGGFNFPASRPPSGQLLTERNAYSNCAFQWISIIQGIRTLKQTKHFYGLRMMFGNLHCFKTLRVLHQTLRLSLSSRKPERTAGLTTRSRRSLLMESTLKSL